MTAVPALTRIVERLHTAAATYREPRERLRAWFATRDRTHLDWRSLELNVGGDAAPAEVSARLAAAAEARFPDAALAAVTLYVYTPDAGHLPAWAEMVHAPRPKSARKPEATPDGAGGPALW